MVQRQVIVRDAGHQLLDELDATDIPALAYDASGAAASAASGAASALSTHAGAADPHTVYALESALGTMSTQNANGVNISGGAIAGITDLAVADGGTGSSTAANARTALGLVIGTDVRAQGSGDPTVPAFATPSVALGTAAAAGAASTVIRSDATIAAFDATVPVTQAYSDAAATGSATVAARRDHVHGMPAAGSGAPADATYLTTAAHAGLSAEVVVPTAVLTVLDDTTVAAMVDTLGGASSTGTGGLVRATSPTLVTPALGTPASGVATNLTGTAAGLTAGSVTTNANLTGDVTSVGNATTIPSLSPLAILYYR